MRATCSLEVKRHGSKYVSPSVAQSLSKQDEARGTMSADILDSELNRRILVCVSKAPYKARSSNLF